MDGFGCIRVEFYTYRLHIIKNSVPVLNNGDLLKNMDIVSDLVSHHFWYLAPNLTVLAQNITDPNILGQMQKAFTHFIQSGQAWALLIGLVIGYMIRNLTSYG